MHIVGLLGGPTWLAQQRANALRQTSLTDRQTESDQQVLCRRAQQTGCGRTRLARQHIHVYWCTARA